MRAITHGMSSPSFDCARLIGLKPVQCRQSLPRKLPTTRGTRSCELKDIAQAHRSRLTEEDSLVVASPGHRTNCEAKTDLTRPRRRRLAHASRLRRSQIACGIYLRPWRKKLHVHVCHRKAGRSSRQIPQTINRRSKSGHDAEDDCPPTGVAGLPPGATQVPYRGAVINLRPSAAPDNSPEARESYATFDSMHRPSYESRAQVTAERLAPAAGPNVPRDFGTTMAIMETAAINSGPHGSNLLEAATKLTMGMTTGARTGNRCSPASRAINTTASGTATQDELPALHQTSRRRGTGKRDRCGG